MKRPPKVVWCRVSMWGDLQAYRRKSLRAQLAASEAKAERLREALTETRVVLGECSFRGWSAFYRDMAESRSDEQESERLNELQTKAHAAWTKAKAALTSTEPGK